MYAYLDVYMVSLVYYCRKYAGIKFVDHVHMDGRFSMRVNGRLFMHVDGRLFMHVCACI